MKRERVWLDWKCIHCGRRHKDNVIGMMQCNDKEYCLRWKCDKCRKKNQINIYMRITYDYSGYNKTC